MPIYEYRCEDCRRVSSVFVRSARATVTPACEHCGSSTLTRLVSRVARMKSAGAVQAEYGSGETDGYRDPRQIGSWVEQRFQEYGMDVPEETRAMIDAAREGELPKEIRDL
ncbi:MAG: zinc ribbon domain-containing protein [Chloroflexi bacterium]|nr:zinc ribbon domain-containing protein [Chloroflexota bacterium]MQC48427.1 zinc ribbon domain-containing protein [Chloroflexota bacterium]